jgi:hypothetical protein
VVILVTGTLWSAFVLAVSKHILCNNMLRAVGTVFVSPLNNVPGAHDEGFESALHVSYVEEYQAMHCRESERTSVF